MRWNVARNVIPDVMQCLVAWGSVLPNVLPSANKGESKKLIEKPLKGLNEAYKVRKSLQPQGLQAFNGGDGGIRTHGPLRIN